MSTPEEFLANVAQGVGQSVGETAGSRLQARGAERDRRRTDGYDRKMRAADEERTAAEKADEAFNAAISAGRSVYSHWCRPDLRETIADDPFITGPEELDAQDWEIQANRSKYHRFQDAVTELNEALDALVPWYAALPEWTVDQDPTREQLTTLIRDLEHTRDARRTQS